jgi:hypothetical protein
VLEHLCDDVESEGPSVKVNQGQSHWRAIQRKCRAACGGDESVATPKVAMWRRCSSFASIARPEVNSARIICWLSFSLRQDVKNIIKIRIK